MGTTLTGTTPQDTYDSLIKVTDNGPLSGTAKYLSDGLGNDSALAVSTSAVGIGTTSGTSKANILSSTVAQTVLTLEGNYSGSGSVELLEFNRSGGAVSGAIKYQDADTAMAIGTTTSHAFIFNTGDAERMRITSAGKVGINTTSALGQLNIRNESAGATTNALALYNNPSNTENTGVAIEFYPNVGVDDRCARISAVNPTTTGENVADLRFFTSNNAAPTEKLRILASGGITFNGDTAAANALDDYEEGTFTPTTSSDPTGAFSGTTGEYTKIGNVVHFRIVVAISSNFADNFVGGLPFTVGGSSSVSAFSGAFNVANENFPDIIATTIAGQSYIRFYTNNDTNNQAQPATTWGTLRIFGSYRV
jgi:hypothetical protein